MKLTFVRTSAKIAVLILVIGIVSCSSCRKNADQDPDNSSMKSEKDSVKNNEIKKILFRTPLPINLLDIFKAKGIYYEPDFMNKPEKALEYETNKKKAINLGVFGVDMGYAHVFDQTNDYMRYMQVIIEMAKDLGVSGEYAESVIARMNNATNNKDSLLSIAEETYKTATDKLREDSESLRILILLGGWIEGMYVATQMYDNEKPNEEIERIIAEQKYVLGELTILLQNTILDSDEATDELYAFLRSNMGDLQNIYSQVELSWKKEEVAMDKQQSALVSTADVIYEITPGQIAQIKEIIQRIRRKTVS